MKLEYNPKTGHSGGVESKEAKRDKIEKELRELGIVDCPPEIVDRLLLLDIYSGFLDDCRMITEGVKNVSGEKGSIIKLSSLEIKRLILAAYLHDIGKTGPSKDLGCQLAVVKLFSVKGIQNITQTVEKTLEDKFPGEKVALISQLEKVGVTADMPMSKFWRMHATWTKDVLADFPALHKDVQLVAASHHIDAGDNPYGIDEEEISSELKYSIFLLMAIDKYQAKIERDEVSHKEAIQFLIDVLVKHYDGDKIMESIVKTIDELGPNDLFPKTRPPQRKLIEEKEK